VLLFFGLLLQGGLLGGVCQETGDKLVGELLEGLVNLWFQLREGGGIIGELIGPALLLGEELVMDVLKGRLRGRDISARLGVQANTHGKSFRCQ
jgi:hypothetical protein